VNSFCAVPGSFCCQLHCIFKIELWVLVVASVLNVVRFWFMLFDFPVFCLKISPGQNAKKKVHILFNFVFSPHICASLFEP